MKSRPLPFDAFRSTDEATRLLTTAHGMLDNFNTGSWTVADAEELFDVQRWGRGYFAIGGNGNLMVRNCRESASFADVKEVIDQLRARGLDLPVLLRFNGLLDDRLRRLNEVFSRAIDDNEYSGKYCCVYPLKVNQQRSVVTRIVDSGQQYGYGLEVGSKAELLAATSMTARDTPIVCNGFKDEAFIEMALRAQQIGRCVIPAVEKFSELGLILNHADRLKIRPQIGMRMKLASRGSGRWKSSGGYRSKFGLAIGEILRAFEVLKSKDMLDCFQLLHFHPGSQVTNIQRLKSAVNEAARVYADLSKRGAGLRYLDVGGGLGVDYSGSQNDFQSSMNYSLQEYANDVVFHIATVCNEARVPHPDIITESGRAVAAIHSAVIFETLGVSEAGGNHSLPQEVSAEYEQPLQTLAVTWENVCLRNVVECWYDAQQAFESALNLFVSGHLPLEQRVLAEDYFSAICRRLRQLRTEMDFIPEELQSLDQLLSETYFCNFSLFQSMPDSWAISQLFPVMPIHRLDERPDRPAVLADVTCDSDGKIDTFIDRRGVRKTLPLHSMNGEPYLLGAFLLGAYQETLGDLHNLFGNTNVVQVDIEDDGRVTLQIIQKGDTVREVLSEIDFNAKKLVERLKAEVQRAVEDGLVDDSQGDETMFFFEESLNDYTYPEKV